MDERIRRLWAVLSVYAAIQLADLQLGQGAGLRAFACLGGWYAALMKRRPAFCEVFGLYKQAVAQWSPKNNKSGGSCS